MQYLRNHVYGFLNRKANLNMKMEEVEEEEVEVVDMVYEGNDNEDKMEEVVKK